MGFSLSGQKATHYLSKSKVFGVILLLAVALALLLSGCAPTFWKVVRYQFADIDDYQIFPIQTVPAGLPQAWKLGDGYGKITPNTELIKKAEAFGPVAFLVVQDGKLIYERYWEGHTQNSYSSSFSMAKSIVGMLTGIALREGKIKSLDQSIGDFIPEFREGAKSKITFRHLLTMTSGLDWDEAYTNPFSPTTELYYGEDLYSFVTGLKPKDLPGKRWYYSSADTQILGIALEKAVGLPLSVYLSEKLWKPIGAEQDATWSMDKAQGTIKFNCCFNSTPRDFARLGQLVLQKGMWNNQSVVPSPYLLEATQPAPNLFSRQNQAVNYYGYQFWIPSFDQKPAVMFNGILGQYIIVVPHLNAVAVRLGHRDDDEGRDYAIYEQLTLDVLRQNAR